MQEEGLYSAPRTFDIATLLVVTFAYALLFAGLRLLDSPSFLFAFLSGLISWVGIAQAAFHGKRSPRQVSVVAGLVYFEIVFIGAYLFQGSPRKFSALELFCSLIGSVPGGTGCGYLAGALVGGVFMLAEVVRNALGRLQRAPKTSHADEKAGPWSDGES